MKRWSVWGAISLCALLVACSRPPKLVALGGAPTDRPGDVAQIREGSMFVRGFDRARLGLQETQNPFSDFVYAVTPGRHAVLAMNIQSGHVVPTEGMRCYVVEAEFRAGVLYRLDEDKGSQRAVLRREADGVEIASGKLLSQQSAFGNPCDWQ